MHVPRYCFMLFFGVALFAFWFYQSEKITVTVTDHKPRFVTTRFSKYSIFIAPDTD